MTDQNYRPVTSANRHKLTNKQFEWNCVRNFFIWTDSIKYQKYFINISKDGNVSLITVKGKDYYRRFVELWKDWSNIIKKNGKIEEFEYPVWGIIKDDRNIHRSRISVIGGMCLCVSILLLYPVISTPTAMINISTKIQLALSLMLLGSILLVLIFMRYPRKFCRVSITDYGLKVNFVDGKIQEFSLKDVRRYCFAVETCNAFIVFNDKTKLIHLERVSYWPILREYLLSKLEPLEKHEDK